MKLTEAIGTVTEMFHEVGDIAHPYTDSHIRELGRRCHEIGACFTGEEATKFQAVVSVGMQAVAEVQKRNACDTVELIGNKFVTTAQGAPLSGAPRWEERLESLEFSLAAFGVPSTRVNDDTLQVQPIKETVAASRSDAGKYTFTYGMTPKDVIAKNLPAFYKFKPDREMVRTMHKACPKSAAIQDLEAGEQSKLSRADMEMLLAALLKLDSDEAMLLRSDILGTVGIEEV